MTVKDLKKFLRRNNVSDDTVITVNSINDRKTCFDVKYVDNFYDTNKNMKTLNFTFSKL